MKTVRALALASLMLTLTTLSFGPQEARVLRFPAVSNDQIVFTSDGDIFPYRFKTLKLGKVIGKRTWGGGVGIRGTLPFPIKK